MLLFDGVSTKGWRGAYLDSFPAQSWEVHDGMLMVRASGNAEAQQGGDIVTVGEYGSFDLKVEFKLTTGANSGIKYFVMEELPRTPGSAKGLEFTWEGMSCQGKEYYGRSRGVTIHGTTGTVLIDRDGWVLYTLDDKKVEEFSIKGQATSTRDLVGMDTMTIEHFRNWIGAIRTGEPLRSPIAEGNISVTMLLLSNIAWKTGRALDLDPATGRIQHDAGAMAYWQREYEKGWEPKV